MRHSLPLAPQFYVTAPQPCPYLVGRMERKLFTALQGEQADDLNDTLSKQGFRRSQNVLYRPSCSECSACLSARIRVADFDLSKNQRRVEKKNPPLLRRTRAPWQSTIFADHRGSPDLPGKSPPARPVSSWSDFDSGRSTAQKPGNS